MGICMSKKRDVVVLGAATVDYITHVVELPKPGEAAVGTFMERYFGGLGANQSLAAAKLGASTALLTKLGTDKIGEEYRKYLKDQDVEVDFVDLAEDTPTDLTEVAISDEDDYFRINVPGASNTLALEYIISRRKCLKSARVLLCQLDVNFDVTMYALRNFKKGISILHMSPMQNDIPPELIKLPNILVMNQDIAAKLAEMKEIQTPQDAREAESILLEKGAKSVIILMADHSAVHMSKTNPATCTLIPAREVKFVSDCSGGEDAFMGSLAYHIAKYPKLPREHHISAANACYAYSIGLPGTHPSFPGEETGLNNMGNVMPSYTVISKYALDVDVTTPPMKAPKEEVTDKGSLEEDGSDEEASEEETPQQETPKTVAAKEGASAELLNV